MLPDVPGDGAEPAGEWIVLYNRTASEITLTGWTLRDSKASTTLPSFSIAADSFALIAASEAVRQQRAAFDGTWITLDGRIGNGLGNSGDQLVLLDSAGQAIDGLSWGSERGVLDPPVALAAAGTPLKRNLPHDTDTAADWGGALRTEDAQAGQVTPSQAAHRAGDATAQSTSTSATTEPTSSATPRIILSEIPPAHDWIELYNSGDAPCILQGWQIDDEDPDTAPLPLDDDTAIEAHQVLVIEHAQLAELHGGTLRLLRPDGSVADLVTLGTLDAGATLSRFPVQGGGWQRNTPSTAGQFNRPAPLPATATPIVAQSVAFAPTPHVVPANDHPPAPSQSPARTASSGWWLWVLAALLAALLLLAVWLWRDHLRRAPSDNEERSIIATRADEPSL